MANSSQSKFLESTQFRTQVQIVTLIFGALLFGWLTHWKLFEYDALWLSRAGEEILQTWNIHKIETWSHTAYGHEWRNIQWMTAISIYLSKIIAGSMTGAIWLRSLLVTLLFGGVIFLVARSVSKTWVFFFTALLLTPWLYLMNWIRFQMRADLFGILFFITLILIFLSNWQSRKKYILGLLVLCVWANFHTGTVPFGILLYCATVFVPGLNLATINQKQIFQRALWCLAAFLTWFATPHGIAILDIIKLTFTIKLNPDLQPFTFKLLSYAEGGWSYSLGLAYLVFAIGTLLVHWNRANVFPGFYQSRLLVFGVGSVYTVLFCDKIRVIPYLTLFLLPVVLIGLRDLLTWGISITPRLSLVMLAIVSLFFWGYAIPDQKKNISVPIGNSLAADWLPIQSVEFIKRVRPKHHLLNFFNFGGYLLENLRDYPVSIDGRELPFLNFEKTMRKAMRYPDTYAEFLKKRNINIALESMPLGEQAQKGALYYPKAEWARVFYDVVSVVYLRRIPEHAEIIAKYEGNGSGTSAGQANLSQAEIQNLLRQAQEKIERDKK